MFAYPTSLPLEEAQNVVAIIRAGEEVARRTELGHDAWVVQGYAQHMLLGDPPPVISLQTEFDGLVTLEKLVQAETAPAGTPAAQLNIPWKLLAKWAAQILLTTLAS